MQHQYVCCGQSISEHNSDRLEWNRLNYKVHDKVTVGGGYIPRLILTADSPFIK